MRERSPMVSIVIATYNRSNYLAQALDSCLTATYSNVEVVVVDDGSFDDTKELVRGYKDSRVRYFYKENGGCSSARNMGIANARGKHIKFLDSDDILLPDTLREEVDTLEEKQTDFCVSDSFEFYFDPRWRVLSKSVASLDPTMNNFAIDLFMTSRNRNCAVLYNRNILDSLMFREDLRYNEDTEFLQRVAIKFRGAYLPKPTCLVRNHPENKSGDSSKMIEVIGAQMESLSNTYNTYHEFAEQLGESRFISRMQEMARKMADSYPSHRSAEAAHILLNKWGVVNYRKSGFKIWRKLKRSIVNGNPLGWMIFCMVRGEIR